MQKSLKISYVELLKILQDRLGDLPKDAKIMVVAADSVLLLDEDVFLEITSEINLPE